MAKLLVYLLFFLAVPFCLGAGLSAVITTLLGDTGIALALSFVLAGVAGLVWAVLMGPLLLGTGRRA